MMQSELFDCPICYVKYHREGKVPKIISTCGHTLCSICLTSILQTQSPQCPLDRKPFDQNLRSADKFPTNILILQLLEEATPLPSCSGDKHKEIADMVCLTDKCTVCKHCVESEAHKGHNILHAAAMKNYTAKKKQELKDQLKSMERDFKPVYDLLKIQKESSKANIKETCNKLINLISLRERELLKEVDDIFFQEKVKVDEMYEEASITSEEILKIIALLDSQTFSQEFLEALGYIPLQNLDDKKSFESIEVMITEMKAKLDSELKDLGALILSKITNFKPLPSKEKVTKFTTRNAANLFFYKNMLPSKPSEINLSEIHEKWYSLPLTCFLINKRFGNYDPIQRYQNRIIQWLFPNFYSSQVNVHSVRLQDYEAEIFRSSIQVFFFFNDFLLIFSYRLYRI